MPASSPSANALPDALEMGSLGVCHLKRYWARMLGGAASTDPAEQQLDRILLDALDLGLGQTMLYLYSTRPEFEAFEAWIQNVTGGVDPENAARFNAVVRGEEPPEATQRWLAQLDAMDDVLSADDLAHWEREGWVIVSDAVDAETLAAAAQLIWDDIGGRADEPASWSGAQMQGLALERYQHPVLTRIRKSPRLHKAFAQLWGTPDLWPSTDRLGFNPPDTPTYSANVQKLHWDVSLVRPIPFGTQGLLYLTDNPAEQGAFRLVSGFHRRLDAWLDHLPPGTVPGQEDLEALGPQPVAGKGGDFVIWNHALPHGPSRNRGSRPRMLLYLNLYATSYRAQAEWL